MSFGGTARLMFLPVKNYVIKGNKILFSRKYLLYTNTAISMSMSMCGDLMVQTNQMRKKEMKSVQWFRNCSVGLTGILSGPVCHYWYLFLDWWIPGRTARVVIKKLVYDQLVCSPVLIGLFLGTLGVLERTPWNELKKEILEKGKILFTAECVVWTPAQVINFYFLPTRYRVLYDNLVSLCFDVYFSHIKYDKESHVTSDDQLTDEPDTSALHVQNIP